MKKKIKIKKERKKNKRKNIKKKIHRVRPKHIDQKGPLIYALNLTKKGLQIFMRRIWPKRASDLCVESDWKGPPNTYA